MRWKRRSRGLPSPLQVPSFAAATNRPVRASGPNRNSHPAYMHGPPGSTARDAVSHKSEIAEKVAGGVSVRLRS